MAVATVFVSTLSSYVVAKSVTEPKNDNQVANTSMAMSKMIVHISSGIDEPHSIMMGLQKALKASEAGTKVFVFFDVEATDAALQTTNIKFADFAPSQSIINDIVAKGSEVYVCPHCLMVNGNQMTEVQTNIKELAIDSIAKFTEGSAVTTLDY